MKGDKKTDRLQQSPTLFPKLYNRESFIARKYESVNLYVFYMDWESI